MPVDLHAAVTTIERMEPSENRTAGSETRPATLDAAPAEVRSVPPLGLRLGRVAPRRRVGRGGSAAATEIDLERAGGLRQHGSAGPARGLSATASASTPPPGRCWSGRWPTSRSGWPRSGSSPTTARSTRPCCRPAPSPATTGPSAAPATATCSRPSRAGWASGPARDSPPPTAKFRMNGTADGYSHEISSPGWGFGQTDRPRARTRWASPSSARACWCRLTA